MQPAIGVSAVSLAGVYTRQEAAALTSSGERPLGQAPAGLPPRAPRAEGTHDRTDSTSRHHPSPLPAARQAARVPRGAVIMRTTPARSPPWPGTLSSTPHYRHGRIVLQVKAPQVGLPQRGDLGGGGTGGAGPQPHRGRLAVAGEPGRPASSQASRITSYPASMTTMMSPSPGRQCPAAASRRVTSRSCAAVTSVGSSSRPSRIASSGAVHEVAPGSSAATTEYGQPRIICPAWRPRPCTWQNSRSGLVRASGRSQQHTSTASRIRPSGQAGSGRHPTAQRSRPISIAPAFSAS